MLMRLGETFPRVAQEEKEEEEDRGCHGAPWNNLHNANTGAEPNCRR